MLIAILLAILFVPVVTVILLLFPWPLLSCLGRIVEIRSGGKTVKRLLLVSLFAIALAVIVTITFAQTTHTAVLTWTPSVDDTTSACAAPNTCSQNVYRAAGTCPQTFSVPYATGISSSATTYTDNAPLFGNSCYAVTFIINGVESVDSNLAGGSLRPAPQTGLTVTEK